MVFKALILVVAMLHIYFLCLECFFWEKPLGLKTFKMSVDKAAVTAMLAKNQGIYNGFLAAGLLACIVNPSSFGQPVLIFFLLCILVAAITGALTVSLRILWIQGLLPFIALVWILFKAYR